MTANPILIEARRGGGRESLHRGALAVWSIEEGLTAALGEVDRAVPPRSAVKALQAIPLIECGAADAFGLEQRHLALACASHSGAPAHVEGVQEMLARSGLDEGALACGSHWPLGTAEAHALARAGQSPRPVHNNCSGKHAGMLACAVRRGLDPHGYELADHGVQAAIAEVLEALTGAPHRADEAAVDGCSVPTWPVPLMALARAFARFASGAEMTPERAEACRRLREACFAEPFMVAGRKRFCTRAMRLLGNRAFIKGGAEGVYCIGLPDRGIGVAIKIDDGAKRAAEAVAAAALAALLPDERETVGAAWDFRLFNWRGIEVGALAATPALEAALHAAPIAH